MGTFDLFFHLILGLVGALWNSRESPMFPPLRSNPPCRSPKFVARVCISYVLCMDMCNLKALRTSPLNRSAPWTYRAKQGAPTLDSVAQDVMV